MRYDPANPLLQSVKWTRVDERSFRDLPAAEKVRRIRHSCSHILATALTRRDPETRYATGPATEFGFFYDVSSARPLSADELPAISAEMNRIIEQDPAFEYASIGRSEAKTLFSYDPYKQDLLEKLKVDEVGLYRVADSVDLCAGPHVPSARYCKAFQLLTLASAHWRDEKMPSLTRVSGTAWSSMEELEKYLHFLQEVRARDHRVLGPEMELFTFHDWAASALWHPKGLIVRRQLEALWRETIKDSYVEILNPLLYRRDLFVCSGHWDYFQDDMFIFKGQEGEPLFALKPMNCPDTMLFFRSKTRSYRELPLRVAEGQVLHRNENTGSLHGIMRGRSFVQDDAHIFLSSEQVKGEFQSLLLMLDVIYGVFSLKYGLRLSTRPAEFLGDAETWDRAESDLKAALDSSGKAYAVAEGEGAFYGPKIDVTIHDSLGREWQCATFQLDFQLPIRFDLEYAAEDGSRPRPIVIHRAIFGSFERFIGVLIEHLNGRFPTWLAPVQLAVLPISDKFASYAATVEQKAQTAGLRCEMHQEGSLNQRIRTATKSRIPNVCIVGAKEAEAGTVSWRSYSGENKTLKLEEFVEIVASRVRTRFFDTAVTSVQPPSLKDGSTPEALNVQY